MHFNQPPSLSLYHCSACQVITDLLQPFFSSKTHKMLGMFWPIYVYLYVQCQLCKSRHDIYDYMWQQCKCAYVATLYTRVWRNGLFVVPAVDISPLLWKVLIVLHSSFPLLNKVLA